MDLFEARRAERNLFDAIFLHGFHAGLAGQRADDLLVRRGRLGKDLCQHVTFSKPMAINKNELPAEMVNQVKTEARQEAIDAGKPEQIVDKIAEGKLNAWCAENALM